MLSDDIRARRIGGTDIAAILGVDPDRDQHTVWLDKQGLLERAAATPRMRLGKHMERGIIAYYSELTGRETEFDDVTHAHMNYPFMAWTPDAHCVHERRGVDAKLVAWDQSHRWGETVDEIPARIQLQGHWYMAAEEAEAWDVAALIGFDAPHIYTIERDLDIERAILAAAEEYWTRYIVGNEVPPIGGKAESSAWVKARFPRNVSAIRAATESEERLLDDYAELRVEEDELTETRTLLENTLKSAIGDGDGLVWARGKFTWKKPKDSNKVDYRDLAYSLMRGYSEEERAALIAEHTSTVENSRRIHFHGTAKEAA